MAKETLITDLVAQEALDQLTELDSKMEQTLTKFKDCAKELANGLKINVEVSGDVDKLQGILATQMQKASQATQQLTQQLEAQQKVVANTTNTISRQLMEQEKLNKTQRETYSQQEGALGIADKILGTYDQNIQLMAKLDEQLKQLNAQYKVGEISAKTYTQQNLELKTAKQQLQRILNNEEKLNQAAAGSYQQLSLQLERMKQAQKLLNEEQKKSPMGRELEGEIQKLDAHLKDLAADMGEFQRNVGNYAIASKSVKKELKELTAQMAQMLADGVNPTSEAFLKVAERAGTLKDAMSDAKATISDYANDTQTLTNAISVLQTGANVFQVYEGAMSAFGFESEESAKAVQKLMGIMSMLNGIQSISTELTTNGTGAYRAYHAILKLLGIEQETAAAAEQAQTVAQTENTVASQANTASKGEQATAEAAAATAAGATTTAMEAETVATTAATASTVALNVALAALGIAAVIALVVALTKAIEEHNEEIDHQLEIYDGLNDATKEGIKSTAGAQAELDYYTQAVTNFNGSAEEEKALVDELNDKYGKSIGYYKNLTQWKKALVDIAPYYLDVLKWEAIAQANLNKYAEAAVNNDRDAMTKYEQAFIDFKNAAMSQQRVVNNMIRHSGALTENPSSNRSSRSSRSASTPRTTTTRTVKDTKKEVTKQMEDLNKEADDLLAKWQTNMIKKTIDTYSVIKTTNKDAYDDQVATVKQAYLDMEGDIEQNRDKAIAAKQQEYDKVIAAAKKEGLDTKKLEDSKWSALTAISADYNEKIIANQKERDDKLKKMHEDYIKLVNDEITKRYANEQVMADAAYNQQMDNLKKRYAEELKQANGNEQKIADIKEKYEADKEKLTEEYAKSTAQRQINMLQEELNNVNLSAEEREQIQQKLTKAQSELAKKEADTEIEQIERVVEADKKAREKKMKNAEDWLNKTAQACQAVTDLASAVFDGQISKVEEQQDANSEAYDAEVARIENLAETGAITEEEAEIRKRDAKTKSAKQEEELTKKKQQLAYKQAVVEKANSIAQIAISTALGIMQTYAQLGWPAGIPGAIFIGALGAIQTATALAQPIKAYAEGTKDKPHPGGLALVGDANKPEMVVLNGRAWITPDSPTLVNLPKGAEVYPEVHEQSLNEMAATIVGNIPHNGNSGQPIIINDYHALEDRMSNNTKVLARGLSNMGSRVEKAIRNQRFNAYLASRL